MLYPKIQAYLLLLFTASGFAGDIFDSPLSENKVKIGIFRSAPGKTVSDLLNLFSGLNGFQFGHTFLRAPGIYISLYPHTKFKRSEAYVKPALLHALELEARYPRSELSAPNYSCYTLTLDSNQMRGLREFYGLLIEGKEKIDEGQDMLAQHRFCCIPGGGPESYRRLKTILGAEVERRIVTLGKLSDNLPTSGIIPLNCSSVVLLALYYAGFETTAIRCCYTQIEGEASKVPDPFKKTLDPATPSPFLKACYRPETVEGILKMYLKKCLHSFLRKAIEVRRLRIDGVREQDQLTTLETAIQHADPLINSDSFDYSNIPDLGINLIRIEPVYTPPVVAICGPTATEIRHDKECIGIINQLYREYLGRDAEPGGRNYWLKVFKAHGYQAVKRGIAHSHEAHSEEAHMRITINQLYREYLGRDAEPGGRNHWLEVFKAHGYQAVKRGIEHSHEARSKRGS